MNVKLRHQLIGVLLGLLIVWSNAHAGNTGWRNVGLLEFRGDGVFVNLVDWVGVQCPARDDPNATVAVNRLLLSSDHEAFESLHSVLLTASTTGRRISLVFFNGNAGCVQVGVHDLIETLAIRFEPGS